MVAQTKQVARGVGLCARGLNADTTAFSYLADKIGVYEVYGTYRAYYSPVADCRRSTQV